MTGTGTSAPTLADRTAAAERRGVRIGLTAYVMWGFLTVYWKQLSAFDAAELIGWRMVCAAAVMIGLTTIRGTWPLVAGVMRRPRSLLRLGVAALLLAVNWWSYVYAVVSGRVIETALGYFLAPLATMALGVTVLGERPRRAHQVAFVLAALSVTVVTVEAGAVPWVAIAIATSWSLYGLSKRGLDLPPVDGLAAETFVLALPATVFVIVTAGSATSVVSTAEVGDWPFVLGTGVVTVVPLALFAAAARSVPFTVLGPLNLLVPIINFALGWLWYDESVSAVRFVGFVLVAIAVVVVLADRIAVERAGRRRSPAAGRYRAVR